MKLLLLLAVALVFVECVPEDSQEKPSEADKPDEVADEEETLVTLRKYVKTVPISKFEGDAFLIQFPDYLNKKTQYRHVDLKLLHKIVFERHGDDVDKEVVILTAQEDGAGDWTQAKKIYTVLRKAHLDDKRLYYVAYLYVKAHRYPGFNYTVHKLNGQEVSYEWDLWDHRSLPSDKHAKKFEGSFDCSSTIFVPCKSNETRDLPLPFFPLFGKKVFQGMAQVFLPKGKPPADPSDLKEFKLREGYDANAHVAFLYDLELTPKAASQAKFGRKFDNAKDVQGSNIGQGVNKIVGSLAGNINQVVAAVLGLINDIVQVGMGLIKNFGGLFGGLGTPEASTEEVEEEVFDVEEEEGEGVEDNLTSAESKELSAEMDLPSAGGTGGLVNADEEEDMLKEEEAADSKSMKQKNKNKGSSGKKPKKKQKGRGLFGSLLGGIIAAPAVVVGSMVAANRPKNQDLGEYVQFGWLIGQNKSWEKTEPFIGFGNCRYNPISQEDFAAVKSKREILKLYQTSLRTQCLQRERGFLLELFENDALKINPEDKTIDFKKDKFMCEKLTLKQLKQLYRAIELNAFTKVYQAELNSPTKSPDDPAGIKISRSVYFYGHFVLKLLNAKFDFPLQHGKKLNRNIVKTIRLFYFHLLQDEQYYTTAKDEKALNQNYNDKVYIMGLMQFMLNNGFGPAYQEGADLVQVFNEFYTNNFEAIEQRVAIVKL